MKSASQWGDDLERRPVFTLFKAAVIGTLAVLAIIALVGVLTTGSVFFQAGSAKLTNKARETLIVFNPERTLATYEGFYTTCNSYNATLANAHDAEAEAVSRQKNYDPTTDPFGNEQKSIGAIRENARGLRNTARDLAAEYNAASSANTRAPFKAAELPYTLDANGQEPANCGSGKEGKR